MLAPDSRTVAVDVLRPPPGYRLDHAVLTTYSLDLEVLLSLPLAVLAQSDQSVEALLEDPLLLLEGLREAGERLQVFVDHGGIGIPANGRSLYALLEGSVHPVRAPNGGAFHPKIWVVRFLDEADRPLIRVAIMSRNLTYDRCWDVLLISEGTPQSRRAARGSRALAALLAALPGLGNREDQERAKLETLATEVAVTTFPAPEGCEGPIAFETFGLSRPSRKPWRPAVNGARLLAAAPFANRTALEALIDVTSGPRTLISRREALDALPEDALADWDQVFVLSDVAAAEPEDDVAGRPSGFHAKLIGIEHSRRVTWYVGSANLTRAAFTSLNVEVIASITAPKGNANGKSGFGIQRFCEAGFLDLCESYRRTAITPEDAALTGARAMLEEARAALLASNLRVKCRTDEDGWLWQLEGKVALPRGVSVAVWPVSINEDQARPLHAAGEPCLEWRLPVSHLTAFVAFRLSVEADIDDVRLAIKLPVTGMPEGRIAQVLRTLIDSPERFLQFLRALLGGLDGLANWNGIDAKGRWEGPWGAGLRGETLLEDLVRTASRDPERLEPVRRLIEDLRATEEGRAIVPEDLYAMWQVVETALHKRQPKKVRQSA